MPGDDIEVHLHYVEELVPSDGIYEFVFPMVVGPRYVGGARDASRIAPPVLAAGRRPGSDVAVHLRIHAGVEVSELASPSHDILIDRPASDMAEVQLQSAVEIANRDLVIRYRLGGKAPQLAFLANREPRGSHFLLMLQPPSQLGTAEIAPREYVFVIDTSGSMAGYPLQIAKDAMRRLLQTMRPVDRFQLI